MENEIWSSAVIAYITSHFLEFLKHRNWFPLMNSDARKLNIAFSALVAFFASIGIHMTFDAAAGTLLITGLTVGTILSGLWHWVQQFAMQQVAYSKLVRPTPDQLTITRPLGTGDGKTPAPTVAVTKEMPGTPVTT